MKSYAPFLKNAGRAGDFVMFIVNFNFGAELPVFCKLCFGGKLIHRIWG